MLLLTVRRIQFLAFFNFLLLDLALECLLQQLGLVLLQVDGAHLGSIITERDDVLRVFVLLIERLNSVDKHLVLVLAEQLNERLCAVPMNLTLISNVVLHVG